MSAEVFLSPLDGHWIRFVFIYFFWGEGMGFLILGQ